MVACPPEQILPKEPGLITGWLLQPTLTYFIARLLALTETAAIQIVSL